MGTQSEPSLTEDIEAAFEGDPEEIEIVEEVIEEVAETPEEVAATEQAPKEVPELPPLTAPNTWKKEYSERFNDVPREVAEYILQREEEMARGIGQKGQEIADYRQRMENLNQVISPFAEQWARNGLDAQGGLRQVMSWYQALQQDPQGTLMQLAKTYGIDMQQAFEDQPYVDPQVAQMEQQMAAMRQQIEGFTQSQAQQKQHAAIEQIKQFESATDDSGNALHPHFQSVYGKMVMLMQSGEANSLESAYEQALWMDPNIRSELTQQQAQQAAHAKNEQAQKIKAAAEQSVSSKEVSDIDDSDLDLRAHIAKEMNAAGF